MTNTTDVSTAGRGTADRNDLRLPPGEPVTPTRKVKRKLMYERFRDLVDGMYDDSEERLIAAGAGDVKF